MSQQSNPNLIGRRDALCTLAGIATAVAGIGLVGIGSARADEARTTAMAPNATISADEVSPVDEIELARVRVLVPESLDVGNWKIERVAPRLGAVAVVMRTPEGAAFQVDVLRRDPAVAGVAETRHFSLFVANAGDGSTATDDLQARGAIVLAHQIRHRELTGAPPPQLLSFTERATRFPLGEFGVMG